MIFTLIRTLEHEHPIKYHLICIVRKMLPILHDSKIAKINRELLSVIIRHKILEHNWESCVNTETVDDSQKAHLKTIVINN